MILSKIRTRGSIGPSCIAEFMFVSAAVHEGGSFTAGETKEMDGIRAYRYQER